MAREAAETVVLVIDEEGVESLISELLKAASDSQVLFNKLFIAFCHLLISISYVQLLRSLEVKLEKQMDCSFRERYKIQ